MHCLHHMLMPLFVNAFCLHSQPKTTTLHEESQKPAQEMLMMFLGPYVSFVFLSV
jgi:hypothetical protein